MQQFQIDIPTQEIENFCRRWKVVEFSLFGSVLCDSFGPDSDVDVLIEFGADVDWSLYDWMDMIEELRAIFSRRVDLVSKRGLRNPFRRHAILTTREIVYAA